MFILRVPKTTFWLDDSLEELMGVRKTGIFPVMVYYSQCTQIKVSEGEAGMGQSPGKSRHKLPSVPSMWSPTNVPQFSQQQCVTDSTY